MTKKMEKLKEINNQLNEAISKLETKIFIEKITDFSEHKIKESQTMMTINLK